MVHPMGFGGQLCLREEFLGACDQAKQKGLLLGKVPLLLDGDGPGVFPRFLSKEITPLCCWYLAGHSGRDDLKFFAKGTIPRIRLEHDGH